MGRPRPLAGLVSVVLLVVVGLVVLLPDCASACSCAALPGTPQERASRALSDSEAVFSGEVVDFEKSPPPTTMMEGTMYTILGSGGTATATVRVSKVWKGPRQETVRVTTEADSSVGCGYPFEEGQEYLVYAGKGTSVSLCSETKPLSEAGAELEALGEGERPNAGGALSDTSGGVSVGAMAGLAGLTMAASFVLALRLMRTG